MGKTSLGWADVVAVMEFYYRHPHLWRMRVKHQDQIAFTSQSESSVFDIEKRQRKRETGGFQMSGVPDDFCEQIEPQGLLHVIWALLFRGKLPEGEPVPPRSKPVVVAWKLDYANDPKKG